MEPRPPFDPRPVRLIGVGIELVPLTREHAPALLEEARDAGIWTYLPLAPPRALEDVEAWIDAAAAGRERRGDVPFAILARAGGRAIGSTRFLDVDKDHRRLEIGWTWLGAAHRRTAANTECKLLLLAHAFDELGAVRVQFKTDARNLRSQTALERIGARREGTLRHHMVLPDGFLRDSAYFSVIAAEWPATRARLDALLRRDS